jgi:hypothetical protein
MADMAAKIMGRGMAQVANTKIQVTFYHICFRLPPLNFTNSAQRAKKYLAPSLCPARGHDQGRNSENFKK